MHPIEEFIARYGDRAVMVLRAILEASRRARRPAPGDFDFKGVKAALARMGFSYNPAPLLSILEREYGVIETTYKTSGQHWWRIVDRRIVEEALRDYLGEEAGGDDDPRLKLLRIQFYSLNPHSMLEFLQRTLQRRRLTRVDLERLRRLAFEDLPLLVKWLEEARSEYPDELADEISLAEDILEMAEEAAAGPRQSWASQHTLRGRIGEPLQHSPERFP